MTSKADFTEEEWTRLKRAPLVAGMAITLADPGGPIEITKETSAALKTVLHGSDGRGELVGAIAAGVTEDARHRHSPMKDFKPSKGANAGVEILEELSGVNGILAEKASPEDAAAVREWLLTAAQNAANAAKEGGFMGYHSVRVSEGEEQMLGRLREVLA
jgi:hypothetical protein